MVDRPTLDEYLQAVADAPASHPDWREGQTFYNVVRNLRPDLAQQLADIAATDLDPYTVDARLPAFLDWVDSVW